MSLHENVKRLGKRAVWTVAPGLYGRLSKKKGAQMSIGIFRGDSPFTLAPHPEVTNPVLTKEHVTDLPAAFVADPFMIRHEDRWLMFFEVFSRIDYRGSIGLATSPDGLRWVYDRIVLKQPFHLAYPQVFQSGGDFFMVPDTPGQGIRLYRAEPFPHRWRYVRTLVDGPCWCDPTVFTHDDRWWMLVASSEAKDLGYSLRLLCSDSLEGQWREHAASPIRTNSLIGTRPSGRVLAIGGRLVRFAQDCSPHYGSAVRAWNITTLTESLFGESEAASTKVLQGSGAGWNADGMHHVDAHLGSDGAWLACVDGWRWSE